MTPTPPIAPVREIIRLHGEIITAARTSLDKAIRIGELLSEQKARLDHGQWLPWVKENLPFDDSQARRYMAVHKRRDEIPNRESAHDLTFSDAYRLLSAPIEPEPEALRVEALATAGERGTVTAAVITEIAAELTPRGKAHVSHNSGDNEWYTPPEYTEAAWSVMGGIDCDPASSEIANRTVNAVKYFTKDDDGLSKRWRGRVFLNPPYSQPLVAQFAEAVASKFESEEIQQAVVLVNNATETAWFARIAGQASAICFPSSRIKFIDPSGAKTGAPLQGQAILYLGNRPYRFSNGFQKFGTMFFSGGTP